jgi:hypothetical protein
MKKLFLFAALAAVLTLTGFKVIGDNTPELDSYFTKKDAAKFIGVNEKQIIKTSHVNQFGVKNVPVYVVKTKSGGLQIAFPDVANYSEYIKIKNSGKKIKTNDLQKYWDFRNVASNNVADEHYFK